MAGPASTKVDLASGLSARDQRSLAGWDKQHGIVMTGLNETLAALKTIDPLLRKEAQKRIRKVPAEIATKTKGRVPANRPMRNWGGWSRRGGVNSAGVNYGDVGALRWDAKAVKSGIKVLTGGQKLNVRLVNKSGPGAVFEMAGTKNNFAAPTGKKEGPRGTAAQPGGAIFTANLRAFGVAPRLLVKTWRDEKGITRTASEMGKVARFAEEEVNRRIA
jgi:ribosomal protein L39E